MKTFRFVLLMLFSVFAVSANSEANSGPIAYSVNSDSGSAAPTTDSLWSIDLATGIEQRKGELFTGIETRLDTEGLAFAPDGTLWGVDDDSLTIFPINPETGTVNYGEEVQLQGFPELGGNDFGMTFTCDGGPFVTSVRTQTLYRIDLTDGSREAIGGEGALGVNISAIAAYGNPVKMYGLGNGQLENGQTDSPNLYQIDLQTGVATLIGPLGAAAGAYAQGGLAFDGDGNLWAITDRTIIDNQIADLPSQILKIDTTTGTATLVSETTAETGFESLAIVPPAACDVQPVQPSEDYPRLPTLGRLGNILLIGLLLVTAIAGLRKRIS
ncbi:MAG: hypothetical protein PVF89_04295 [Lysobacterales bacterium]|jgi:hypothetical protein